MAAPKALVKKIADLLEEADANLDKYPSQEGIAEAILKIVSDHEKEEEEKSIPKQQLVVVGQVLFRGQSEHVRVALGPFGGRATKAAQTAGGSLSWDSSSHRMGRFMVLPMYKSAFEANKVFASKADADEEDDVSDFVAAMAEKTWHLSDVPACTCGLKSASVCYRHNKELL